MRRTVRLGSFELAGALADEEEALPLAPDDSDVQND